MPAGQSDVREKTRARFDEVLKRYTNPPEKKKSKQRVDQLQENVVLQTIRKNLDFSNNTGEDETVLSNTYNPAQASPRFSKNRRREEEVSEKANAVSNDGEEKPPLKSGKKKSKRTLPPPPTSIQDEEENDRSAQRFSTDSGRERRGKRGNRTEGDGGGQVARSEPDLLQEYQQQISQEEERAQKKAAQKKHGEELPKHQEALVLNNEVGKKKKKKKNLITNEGDESHSEVAADKTSKENVQSDTIEEDKEDTAKPKKKMKKKRQEVTAEESQDEVVSQRRVFDDSLVLGVYVHRTDRLKTDFLVSHPMVKLHVVDEMTGQYVKKEDGHRRVSSFYEQEDIEHILPIITQPFDFKKNKSTVPEWEEQIIFNERFAYFLQDGGESPRVILFFEILDFMSMDKARANPSIDQHEQGFRKIAWAFLKLVGTNGTLNINSKLRLQLYSCPPRAKKTTKTVEVFHWWSNCPRNRYASTLYVTVKGIKLPEHVDPGIRSMMALQQEGVSTTYSDPDQKTSTLLPEKRPEPTRWTRVPGQACRVPNKLLRSLRGGHMGCFTLRFSHDGLVLAAACADRDAFPLVVYEIPSGKVLASFHGHLNIVYDLCWTRDDRRLISASSDGTVRVWNMERLQGLAEKILPHPSFVYCVQCHPHMQSLVVTGGYDGLLRVWNLDIKDVNGQLLQEFEGHKTFVNALCFDSEGTRMFSADSAGLIIVWNTTTEPGSRHGPTWHWNIEKQIRESDLNGIPISSLEVHPNGRRLLVHAKDSVLRVMDLRILAVKKYIGATNYAERINSTFSPCGGFIYSGSEDGLAYVWNTETGDQVAVYSELGYPTALRGVAYHPHEHMVAFCAYGQSQPIHLYLYDRKVALLEVDGLRGQSRAESGDGKAMHPTGALQVQDSLASGMERFTGTARMSLKMQRVRQTLDSVLETHRSLSGMEYLDEQGVMNETRRSLIQQGLNVFLPPPPLLSPHSKLQTAGSLSAHLIPQATLGSQTFGHSAFGQAIRGLPSLQQRSIQDQEVPVQAVADLAQVVSLYDYRANRSDELTFHRGEVIHVLYKDNDSWWFGCLASGQKGYFPTAYVAEENCSDEEPSQPIEAQPRPSDPQRSLGVDRPAKLSAAISATGELRIISEQDTDVEAPSAKMKKKKKKVKKSEISCDLPQRALSDHISEASQASTRKKRPLPRLGAISGMTD
ncbi:jouberin-like [Brachyhypopomus gauderio]|uniref:jouberin-like n=1 Tax=Brachyhypopomus gauderio TaxID=698409 RepID=UPI00404324DD